MAAVALSAILGFTQPLFHALLQLGHLCALSPPTPPWSNFLFRPWLLCACRLHFLLFLPSLTFPLHPTVLWFHPVTLQRLFFFFFFQKSLMTYLSNPVAPAELLTILTITLSCSCSSLFWLSDSTMPSPCSLPISEMLTVTCWWMSNNHILEGKKQIKTSDVQCFLISVVQILSPWSMVSFQMTNTKSLNAELRRDVNSYVFNWFKSAPAYYQLFVFFY